MYKKIAIFSVLIFSLLSTKAFAVQKYATAVFAGGCFWCMEADFKKLRGVKRVISGYTGGHKANPTYKEVSSQSTGHVEAVKVFYDPRIISYAQLLDFFWHHINPADAGGQFVDRGSSYISAIFYSSIKQRRLARLSKVRLIKSRRFSRPIVTKIIPLGRFYRAEKYHQNYYRKNPVRYKWYRYRSGRDRFLRKAWRNKPRTRKKGGFFKILIPFR